MCGIAGIISTNGLPLGEREMRALDAASGAMRHRGPDDEGIVLAPSRRAAFAHRRLSIIDPTPEARQPMMGDAGSILVFNGEIYNYKELRNHYKLNVPNSDTAVLLALLERRGTAILPELRGFFSFAWWQNGELVLARDWIGKKPLYYANRDGKFIFASELRALIASGIIPFHLSREALAHYLRFYSVPHPNSMIEGVSMLAPGSILRLPGNGNHSIERWYRLPKQQPISISYEDARLEMRRILERSVRDRLVSDVPVGAFLSGGLDSNAIVGLAARESSSPIETFTLGFENSKLDETEWAQIGASAFGTIHHASFIAPKEIPELLPDFFGAMDSPTGDGLNAFLVAHAARKANPSLKVVLSGIGGDEAFLGYAKYRWLATRASLLQTIWAMPRSVRSSISEWAMQFPHTRMQAAFRSAIMPEGSRALFSRNEIHELTGLLFVELFDEIDANALLARLRMDIEHYLPDMLLRDLDAMTMAHSLEARAPLLDRELMEFTWQLPLSIKTGGTTKQLLADAVSDILPAALKEKPKTGFELPMNVWLRTTLRPYLDILQSSSLRVVEMGLLKKNAIETIHRDFLAGRSHYLKPWSIIVLEGWLRAMETIPTPEISEVTTIPVIA